MNDGSRSICPRFLSPVFSNFSGQLEPENQRKIILQFVAFGRILFSSEKVPSGPRVFSGTEKLLKARAIRSLPSGPFGHRGAWIVNAPCYHIRNLRR